MTTIPLTIALVCGDWAAGVDAGALEAEVLRAALLVPSRHRFIVYPGRDGA